MGLAFGAAAWGAAGHWLSRVWDGLEQESRVGPCVPRRPGPTGLGKPPVSLSTLDALFSAPQSVKRLGMCDGMAEVAPRYSLFVMHQTLGMAPGDPAWVLLETHDEMLLRAVPSCRRDRMTREGSQH